MRAIRLARSCFISSSRSWRRMSSSSALAVLSSSMAFSCSSAAPSFWPSSGAFPLAPCAPGPPGAACARGPALAAGCSGPGPVAAAGRNPGLDRLAGPGPAALLPCWPLLCWPLPLLALALVAIYPAGPCPCCDLPSFARFGLVVASCPSDLIALVRFLASFLPCRTCRSFPASIFAVGLVAVLARLRFLALARLAVLPHCDLPSPLAGCP